MPIAEYSASQTEVLRKMYPEVEVGGFTHVDGTVQFYSRVNAVLQPAMTVLDYGAGRGAWTDDPIEFRRRLRTIRGKVTEVIGADVDQAVQDNPAIDRHVICPDDHTIPLPDCSIDLIVSDHTFEHIDQPQAIADEMRRVLRPNGWICARTPYRWGYIAVATSLIPNRRHASLLTDLQPERQERDVFPTRYRLNTRRALRRYFPSNEFQDYTYGWTGEPSYFGKSRPLARALQLIGSPPLGGHAKLFIFLRSIKATD